MRSPFNEWLLCGEPCVDNGKNNDFTWGIRRTGGSPFFGFLYQNFFRIDGTYCMKKC